MTSISTTASGSGLALVVDNRGFRPAFYNLGIKRKRVFREKFRLVTNPNPENIAAPVSSAVAGASNAESPSTADSAPKQASAGESSTSALQLADWLEGGYTESMARNQTVLEAMIYASKLPPTEVVNEALLILRTRGFATRLAPSSDGVSGSFSMVRRWS